MRHARRGPQVPDVERPERADFPGVPKPRRKALPVIGGQRHQDVELLLEPRVSFAWRPPVDIGRHDTRTNTESQFTS